MGTLRLTVEQAQNGPQRDDHVLEIITIRLQEFYFATRDNYPEVSKRADKCWTDLCHERGLLACMDSSSINKMRAEYARKLDSLYRSVDNYQQVLLDDSRRTFRNTSGYKVSLKLAR